MAVVSKLRDYMKKMNLLNEEEVALVKVGYDSKLKSMITVNPPATKTLLTKFITKLYLKYSYQTEVNINPIPQQIMINKVNFFLPIFGFSIKIADETLTILSTIKNKIMLFVVLVCPNSRSKKTFENLITKIIKVIFFRN